MRCLRAILRLSVIYIGIPLTYSGLHRCFPPKRKTSSIYWIIAKRDSDYTTVEGVLFECCMVKGDGFKLE
jgi:hypothetical protein